MIRAFLKLKTLWISVVALLLLSIDCIREEDVTAPVAGLEVMLRNNSTKFPEYCDDTCLSNALVIMMLLDWDGYDIRNSETWYSFILPDAMTGIRVTAIDVKGNRTVMKDFKSLVTLSQNMMGVIDFEFDDSGERFTQPIRYVPYGKEFYLVYLPDGEPLTGIYRFEVMLMFESGRALVAMSDSINLVNPS